MQSFYRAARVLEDAFFLDQDQVLLERLRSMRKMAETKETLAEVSGIGDDAILSRLVDLDVRPESLAALAAVPLIAVAWADGELADAERAAVLEHANARGIKPGSTARALLERWLEHWPQPGLLEAWQAYSQALCARLDPPERERLRDELLHATRATAEAAGGFLGIGRISKSEEDVLAQLAAGFCTSTPPAAE